MISGRRKPAKESTEKGEMPSDFRHKFGFHRLHSRLTRHKISDRAQERAWPQAGRTDYTKTTHRSGAVRCIAWLDELNRELVAAMPKANQRV